MPDVKVLSVDAEGSVTMEFDIAAKVITGMDALFQRVVLKFLKTPGTDILDIQSGGGLQSMLFGSAGGVDDPQVLADVAEVVRRVRRQCVEDQQTVALPPSERLADLVIAEATVDVTTSELLLTVSLASEAGQTALRTIGL
tara:strand:+ start:197 stop:619 length:423 start_codon:yes stop_codon:yes gene_type:complete